MHAYKKQLHNAVMARHGIPVVEMVLLSCEVSLVGLVFSHPFF
jgi:hypothetical protein